jgi:hypothetical protein
MGGTGNTTITYLLAELIAEEQGDDVLVIDFDPHSEESNTQWFVDVSAGRTFTDYFQGDREGLEEYIISANGVDILPADTDRLHNYVLQHWDGDETIPNLEKLTTKNRIQAKARKNVEGDEGLRPLGPTIQFAHDLEQEVSDTLEPEYDYIFFDSKLEFPIANASRLIADKLLVVANSRQHSDRGREFDDYYKTVEQQLKEVPAQTDTFERNWKALEPVQVMNMVDKRARHDDGGESGQITIPDTHVVREWRLQKTDDKSSLEDIDNEALIQALQDLHWKIADPEVDA